MATRFYLPSSGTAPITTITPATYAFAGGTVTGFFRAPLVTAKTSTALTTKAHTGTGLNNTGYCFAQYVSPPLSAVFNWESATYAFSIRCMESSISANMFLDVCIRLMSNNGSTERWGHWSAPGIEANTSLRSIYSSVSVGTGIPATFLGDRLFVEVGYYRQSTTSFTFSQSLGDAPATDLDANSLDTGADAPWIELSLNLTFDPEGTVYGTPNQLMMMGCGT